MKQILIFFLLFVSFYGFAQDGTPNLSFGDNGRVVTDPLLPGVVNGERQKITVISTNKIYQVFSYSVIDGAPGDFGIMRYTSEGEPDLSFGTNGVVITDMGANDFATGMVVLSDNSFIVSGYSLSGVNGSYALAKYDANGVLVSGFGTGGKVTTVIGTQAMAYAIQVRTDGKIIVAGLSRTAGVDQVAVAQYESNGTLDLTFGTNGITTTTIGTGNAAAYGLALQPDGKIVVAGFAVSAGGNNVFAVARYSVNGILDSAFDTDGIQTTSIGGFDDAANSVLIQPDGKILLGGHSLSASDYNFAVVRYNINGSLDAGFGSGGFVFTDLSGNSDDYGTALQLETDNKILLTGYTNTGLGTFSDFAVVRYTDGGLPDASFGAGGTGKTIIDFGADEFSYTIALQGPYILLGGYKGASLALARLNNNHAILPVNLLDFTAHKKDHSVLLEWRTESEWNTLKFEVERSADGRNFVLLGEVNASGNSSVVVDYNFTDGQPLAVNLYRLKIIDQDGSYSYSKTLVVRFNDNSSLKAFPNPVVNDLTVQVKLPAGNARIQVLDVTGRLVKEQAVRSSGNTVSVLINMSGLKPGAYFIRVNDQNIKVIKE